MDANYLFRIVRRAPILWMGIYCVGLTASNDSVAADGSDGKSVAIQNDATNYQGDRVRFRSDLLVAVENIDGSLKGYACLEKDTPLRGLNGYAAAEPVNKTDTISKTGSKFRVLSPSDRRIKEKKSIGHTENDDPTRLASSAMCGQDRLPDKAPNGDRMNGKTIKLIAGDTLRVSYDQLTQTPPDRYGFTYGALAVPFKFHLTGNKDFTGASTVGPYFGYRASQNGFGLSYVSFLGYSNISVSQTVNNKNTTQNLAGISYGLGLVATVKGSFQVGGVLGFDRVNQSAGYQYNGKPWVAIEIGYSFLQ